MAGSTNPTSRKSSGSPPPPQKSSLLPHNPDFVFLPKTKIQFSSFLDFGLNFFGFDSFLRNPLSSNSIIYLWCLYKIHSNFRCSLLDFSNQHLSILINVSTTNQSFILTTVHGSNDSRIRRDLWKHLSNFSSTSLPWLVIGDFNAISASHEKLDLNPPNLANVTYLNSMPLMSGLKDLGY